MIIITHQVEYTYNDTIYNDILYYCTVTVMLMVVVQSVDMYYRRVCVREREWIEGRVSNVNQDEVNKKIMELFDSINRQKIHFLLPVSY